MQTEQQAVAHRQMKRLLRSLALFIMAIALLFAGFGGGAAAMWFFGPQLRGAIATTLPFVEKETHISDNESSIPSREERIDLLWKVWDILGEEFIDPDALDEQKMIYGATAGLVRTLGDPNTLFVEPLPAKIIDADMQGSFEGIGATVNMIEGRLTIVRLLPNSPALAAGLQAGDVILEVDDQSLAGMDILEAVSLIRGPRDTVVRLLVQREGTPEPFVVPVTRDKVEMPIIESRMLDKSIAYLRLTEFNAISQKRVHKALQELLGNDPQGLVFDLRGNPGGFLQMSVDIASEFLPKGTLVLKEQERGEPPKEYHAKRAGIATEIPLVVLVNGSSASASEIVAGAIQDNGRGVLIGEKTFGKGSVQNTHRLEDDSSLRVTIARWYLPNGHHLDGEGIVPDIEVPLTTEDMAAGEDPQLERAVAYLLSGE